MDEKIDKRTKEYKTTIGNTDMSPQKVSVGWVHLHDVLFFGKKTYKNKIDVRVDKTIDGQPIRMEYDRTEKELTISGSKFKQIIPVTNIRGYEELKTTVSQPVVHPTSNVSANPSISAQVSGPHDHVFAGLGGGQTGVGAKVK